MLFLKGELISKADKAMYHAKKMGKIRSVITIKIRSLTTTKSEQDRFMVIWNIIFKNKKWMLLLICCFTISCGNKADYHNKEGCISIIKESLTRRLWNLKGAGTEPKAIRCPF